MSQKLLKSTYTFAGMTLISRVLGFVREMILAQVFGASMAFDTFVVAFRIPNLMRVLFGEGAFSQAFVPILSTYHEQKSPEETRLFINRITGNLALVLLIAVLVGELAAPWVIAGFAPGFTEDPVRFDLAQKLLYLTFPYLFFVALTALSGGILNTFNHFGVSAFTPVVLNIVMILSAWFLAPHLDLPIMGLAWGILMAGVAQVLMQIPFLIRIKQLPRPEVNWKDPGVKRVLKQMVPALLGVSVAQISLLIDNFFASFLPTGSISWLYYSDRLIYLPLGVIGVALGTVVLPQLSRHHARNSEDGFSHTLDWGLRCVLMGAMPAAIGLWVLAGPILTTLLRHGEFSNHDVLMTAKSLMAFSLGLPAMMSVKVLASASYARHDIRTPSRIAVVVLLISVVFIFFLIKPFQHMGLALATSLSSCLNVLLLLFIMLKRKTYKPHSGWLAFNLRILLASMLMYFSLYYYTGDVSSWLSRSTGVNVIYLLIALTIGTLSYFLSLWLSGMRPRHFKLPKDEN